MAFSTIIAPQTAAVASQVDYDATVFGTVIIAADTLVSAEVATVFVKANGKYVPIANAAGTAAGLTATVGAIVLPGGVVYGITKGLTAGACGVFGAGIPRLA